MNQLLSLDFLLSWSLLAYVLLTVLAYLLVVRRQGKKSYDRVEREGGGKLVSQGTMNLGYWAILPLARLFMAAGFSPSQVTWLSLGTALLASLSIGAGFFGLASALYLFTFYLDVVDGIIARETKSSSAAGEILDSSIDRYVDFLLLAGLAFYYRGEALLLLLVLAAILGTFMVSYSSAKAAEKAVKPPNGFMKRTERMLSMIFGSCLAGLSAHYIEGPLGQLARPGYPVIFVLFLLATLSNYSAVLRLHFVAQSGNK